MPSEEVITRIEGAVSPSGWALTGVDVCKAARLSASAWLRAQIQSTEDRVSIRTRAINWVRKKAGLLPVPKPPLPMYELPRFFSL
ncbi:hypothetical protein A4X06_0g3407 [Tilletia controversa]|uniref:Uncharacterized protein n=1 Tax=Tilletia controversa TaxID=13291 RepID=A0A8X7SY00_9BASI|nr:hypothetical protein CF328_g2802 [Tilletia controversa]KAE8249063.1 hypothetical protein A4X06_0g3407 [Tilletia controversa]